MAKELFFDFNKTELENILVTGAGISNPSKIIELVTGKYYFDIKYAFEIAVNANVRKIKLSFKCDVNTFSKINDEKVDVSANFDIAFFFQMSTDIDADGQASLFVISEDDGIRLTNIAYATARGIIFTRCQGTVLKKLILPILPNDQIREILPSQMKNISGSAS